MKQFGYLGIGAGVVLVVLSAIMLSVGGVALGFVTIMCGVISICLEDIYKLIDHNEKLLEQLVKNTSAQHSPAEEIIDQLRQEGLLRPGKSLDDESIDDMLDE